MAYCLDEAIFRFGSHIENEINSIQGDNEAMVELQQQRIMEKYLYPEGNAPTSNQFADPAAMFSKG